ncbi:hypothetical protein CCP4SC76_1690016 [Gammaproteobacteria bacterium]
MVSVFAQIDALPSAKPGVPIGNRDIEAIAEDAGLQMRGHVIRTLILVLKVGLVFRHGVVKVALEILAHTGIRVLVYGQ